MRVRLSSPGSWQRLAEDRYLVRLAEHDTSAEVRVFYWYGDEPDAPDPQAWIERVASHELPADAELYGVTFSEGQSALGWPVTLIEGSVRFGPSSPAEARAVRLLYCLQIHDAWAALRVHAPVAHVAGGTRTELLRVLSSAQPEQTANEVVALADLLGVPTAASSTKLL